MLYIFFLFSAGNFNWESHTRWFHLGAYSVHSISSQCKYSLHNKSRKVFLCDIWSTCFNSIWRKGWELIIEQLIISLFSHWAEASSMLCLWCKSCLVQLDLVRTWYVQRGVPICNITITCTCNFYMYMYLWDVSVFLFKLFKANSSVNILVQMYSRLGMC